MNNSKLPHIYKIGMKNMCISVHVIASSDIADLFPKEKIEYFN